MNFVDFRTGMVSVISKVDPDPALCLEVEMDARSLVDDIQT